MTLSTNLLALSILILLSMHGSILVAGHFRHRLAYSSFVQTIELIMLAGMIACSVAYVSVLRHNTEPCSTKFSISTK